MNTQETDSERRARHTREHKEKYERLAVWLGVPALLALIPFPALRVSHALADGDEHLNTLPLHVWDAKHGVELVALKQGTCKCCWQALPRTNENKRGEGVLGLVRNAIKRDREAGREPLQTRWSLSETVCVLKHVARYHLLKGES